MSGIADKKTAIAAALNTVDGIRAFPERPNVLKEGTAFVRWGGWQRGDGHAFIATYRVVIVLPQSSEAAADSKAYALADLVADALLPELFVESFEPAMLPVATEPRGLYALVVTGRSE